MGFDYEIRYKSGRDNPVADALSRVPGSDVLCMAIYIGRSFESVTAVSSGKKVQLARWITQEEWQASSRSICKF